MPVLKHLLNVALPWFSGWGSGSESGDLMGVREFTSARGMGGEAEGTVQGCLNQRD